MPVPPPIDLTTATWFKSSRSNDQGGECVEGARFPQTMAVRDSKNPHGPALLFTQDAWAAAIDAIKRGELDLPDV